MQISRSATPGADSQLAGQLRLRARCECGGFLVPDMHPFDFSLLPQRVGESVERIAYDAVDALDARLFQGRSDKMCGRLGHGALSFRCSMGCGARGAARRVPVSRRNAVRKIASTMPASQNDPA